MPPGARVAVRTAGHWAGAVTAVGAWRAGLTVDLDGAEPAAVAVVREDLDAPSAAERLVVGRGPGARPTGPADGEPFADEVLAQADEFTDVPVDPQTAALRAPGGLECSQRAVLAAAAQVVREVGLTPGGRYLSTLRCDDLDGLVAGLAAALVADAGLLLVPGPPTATTWAHAAAERCGHAVIGASGRQPPDAPPAVACTVAATSAGLAVTIRR